MHLRFFAHISLVAALFGAVACHEDRIEPDPEPRLNAVTVST